MNRVRLATIAGQEAGAQFRSPAFWVLILIVLFVTSALNPVAMIPTGASEVGGERAFVNSPDALAQSFAIGSFFVYTFFAALMAGFAVIRDDEARIGDLLHCTPLSRAEYALGKFAGIAAALGVALAAHLLLALAFYEGRSLLGSSAAAHGQFRPAAYLEATLLFALPGILWVAAVAFAVGLRSRRPMAVYGVPTVLFAYTILVSWNFAPAGLPAVWDKLLMIVDPTSIRWLDRVLFRVDRGIAYFNSAPLALDLTFVLNRLLTLSVAGIALLASMRGAQRDDRVSPPAEGSADRRTGDDSGHCSTPERAAASFRPLGDLAMTSRVPGLLAGTWTILRSEAREILRQPALYLFSAFLMLVIAEVAGTEVGLLGSPMLLTAGGIAVRALPVATVLVCLYLLFSVVESMHRDSATGFDAIFHPAPVSGTAILLGKGLASAAVIAVLSIACVAAGLLLLLVQQGGRVEARPLVLVFGLVLAPTYLLWAAFVGALMVVLRSRTGALAVGLATLAATAALFVAGAMTWVTNWPLWGALRWTDLGTFPLNGEALAWNRAAALGGALFFFALSRALLVRTERDAAASCDRLRPSRVARGLLRLTPFLLLPLMIQGFLAIQIRQGFQGESEAQRQAEYWRRNVATWKEVAPPEIRRIDLRLDLEPADRWMEVIGTYELVNATPEAMRWLPFTVGGSFGQVSWRAAGSPLAVESRSGLDVLTLPQPLPPGASMLLDFAYQATYPRGYTRNGGGAGTFILPAGVMLSTLRGEFLPVAGFVDRETDFGSAGRRRVEPGRFPDGSLPGAQERRQRRGPAFMTRVEVSLPDGYSATSVGVKTKEWSSSGRTYSLWESDRPVDALNLIAGRWQVRQSGDNAVYFYPGHSANVETILETLVAARSRYSEWFHPYPWKELRIAEFPDLETEATSFPTNISFSEGIGFLDAGASPSGIAFSVTAHEVAHQWWGHLLRAAEGPGTGLLVEGMAHYSALLLHESEHGAAARIEFARQLERLYLEHRRVGAERPVMQAEEGRPGDEAILALKGAWVLWMLHNELGREPMLAALRDLVGRHAASGLETTPDDLLEALAARVDDPAALKAFVSQWLDGIVLPEFEVSAAQLERTTTGWRATAIVRNVGTGSVKVEVGMLGKSARTRAARAAEGGGGNATRALRTVHLGPGEARDSRMGGRLPAGADRRRPGSQGAAAQPRSRGGRASGRNQGRGAVRIHCRRRSCSDEGRRADRARTTAAAES